MWKWESSSRLWFFMEVIRFSCSRSYEWTWCFNRVCRTECAAQSSNKWEGYLIALASFGTRYWYCRYKVRRAEVNCLLSNELRVMHNSGIFDLLVCGLMFIQGSPSDIITVRFAEPDQFNQHLTPLSSSIRNSPTATQLAFHSRYSGRSCVCLSRLLCVTLFHLFALKLSG
jgi:hypothetical protein